MQTFAAGEIVPGLQVLDAVQNGTVEIGHTAVYYFVGKDPTWALFCAVPFGLNTRQQNAWFYDGDGMKLMNEFGKKYNLYALVGGNTGAQMGGWFRKEIKTVDDLKGVKMRIPGLAGRVYKELGVDSRLIAPGEIFPNLERGVIDAAEFVGPFLDRQLGLHKVAKYYYTTGWHEMATASELTINKAKWNSLPADLKAIIENACAACNVISEAWCQKNNAEAMEDLVKNQGVIAQPLPDDVVKALRVATNKILDEAVARDPVTKKVHDSYMAYKAKYDDWADKSETVYHTKIRKG
jgi:TRAP-type mannitol/chloroaromatic compound transport system substrate-binding protein